MAKKNIFMRKILSIFDYVNNSPNLAIAILIIAFSVWTYFMLHDAKGGNETIISLFSKNQIWLQATMLS